MKVALICNMNNNFFAIARYLRDRGVDAHLYLLGEHSHFHPSSDSYSQDYKAYTHTLDWIDKGYFNNDVDNIECIRESVSDCDVLIGCGFAPFFLARSGLTLDLFLPYGSDLYQVPFDSSTGLKRCFLALAFGLDRIYRRITHRDKALHVLRKLGLDNTAKDYRAYALAKYQRIGIRSAKHTLSMASGDTFKKFASQLIEPAKLSQSPIPCVYRESATDNVKLPYEEEVAKIRQNYDIVVFHHARHSWQNSPNPQSNKRNDILLRGIAEYSHSQGAKRVALVTLEYGVDVQASKKLINELGIQEHVYWFPQLNRKDIFRLIPYADIGAVDFGNSWVSGGVLYEFMSCSLPIMQIRDDAAYADRFDSLYPILSVDSCEDVVAGLEAFSNEPEKVRRTGREAFEWFQQHVVEQPIELVLKQVKKSRGG
ncbi:hypothetical protein [Alteromonas flava]|uniref:hypothetical protein n=1 Tax=Alteromonas flava TaxID=2048003 RepID=UPI000F5E9155|nr:hypothetical protein [Alteromonas flava]